MNIERPTSNIERRTGDWSGDIYTDEALATYRPRRKSFGFIARANLPVEIFRTERPIRRWIRRFLNR